MGQVLKAQHLRKEAQHSDRRLWLVPDSHASIDSGRWSSAAMSLMLSVALLLCCLHPASACTTLAASGTGTVTSCADIHAAHETQPAVSISPAAFHVAWRQPQQYASLAEWRDLVMSSTPRHTGAGSGADVLAAESKKASSSQPLRSWLVAASVDPCTQWVGIECDTETGAVIAVSGGDLR
jgi:hypothetical protein